MGREAPVGPMLEALVDRQDHELAGAPSFPVLSIRARLVLHALGFRTGTRKEFRALAWSLHISSDPHPGSRLFARLSQHRERAMRRTQKCHVRISNDAHRDFFEHRFEPALADKTPRELSALERRQDFLVRFHRTGRPRLSPAP